MRTLWGLLSIAAVSMWMVGCGGGDTAAPTDSAEPAPAATPDGGMDADTDAAPIDESATDETSDDASSTDADSGDEGNADGGADAGATDTEEGETDAGAAEDTASSTNEE